MDEEYLIKICKEHGIKLTIDKNPSPEKLKRIRKSVDKFNKMMESFK